MTAQRTAASEPEYAIGIGLALLALAVYWFTGPPGAGGDQFVPLADAFLHGRLSIPVDRPWMELVPVPDGDGASWSLVAAVAVGVLVHTWGILVMNLYRFAA